MSHLLKRTKKSCLKLLRKISTSKQLFVQRLDEDDVSSNCNIAPAADAVSYDAFAQSECQDNNNSALQSQELAADAVPSLANANLAIEPAAEQDDSSHALMHGLTSKFFLGADGYEFRRLQQLRSDAASEILDWEPDGSFEPVPGPAGTVRFERVRYKQNVRYLRHTPSNSSLDLHLQTADLTAQPLIVSDSKPQPRARHGPCSVSLGSKFDGHYHNVVITEPPHESYPIVKWDINGNSLDDERFEVSAHWDEFDSRWRQLQLQDRRPGHGAHSQKSSHQSSSCTLETWLDDTEPLSGLFDDQPHSLLPLPHGTGNGNGNSCNLCLKSF